MTMAEVEKMSMAERLEAIELLWNSLATSEENISSPDWHAAILKERIAEIEGGQTELLTLEQLRRRLDARRK